MARPKRIYTEAQKASALAILDATKKDGIPNYSEGARLTKLPRKTLEDWDKGRYVNSDVADLRQQKKGDLADQLEQVAYELIGIMPGKYEDASFKDIAIALGIVIDKKLVLSGQPNSIQRTESAALTNEERADRVLELFKPGEEKRA